MSCFTDGKVDMKKVSNDVLTDFREARIGNITLEKATN